MIRKARDRMPSYWQVGSETRHARANLRQVHNPADGLIDGLERIQGRGRFDDLHTSGWLVGTRRLPRPRTERAASPVAQFSFGAAPDILPCSARRFSGDHPAGSFLDLRSPRGLDFGDVFYRVSIQAGEKFGRDIGPFSDGQRQCLTKNVLRSGRHDAILVDARDWGTGGKIRIHRLVGKSRFVECWRSDSRGADGAALRSAAAHRRRSQTDVVFIVSHPVSE